MILPPAKDTKSSPKKESDIGEMSDIVLGSEKRWRNEPLGWDLVGILPEGHIGDIEEPAGRQIIGVLLQYGE